MAVDPTNKRVPPIADALMPSSTVLDTGCNLAGGLCELVRDLHGDVRDDGSALADLVGPKQTQADNAQGRKGVCACARGQERVGTAGRVVE